MIIPFFGEVTIITGIVSIILLVVGYVIGSSLKNAAKMVLVILILIACFVILGILTSDVLRRVVEVIGILAPIASSLSSIGAIIGSFSAPIVAFMLGVAFGFLKG